MAADRDSLRFERDHPIAQLEAAMASLSDAIDSAARAGQLERLHWLANELGDLQGDVADVLARLGTGPGVAAGR